MPIDTKTMLLRELSLCTQQVPANLDYGAGEPGRPGVQEHDRETQGRSRKAGAGETQGRASTKSEGEAAPKVEKEQPLAKQQRLRER